MPDADADTIARKILEGLRGLGRSTATPDPDDDDEPGDRRGYVPLDRLRRERDKRKPLEEKIPQLEAQLEALSQAYKAELDAIKVATSEEVGRISSTHAEDLRLVDLDVKDPLGRRVLREAWADLPKDGRGKSAADWWAGVRAAAEAHRADPKANPTPPQVPRPLEPYLGALSAPPAPPPKAGGQPPPGPGAPPSMADLPGDIDFDTLMQRLRQG